MGSHVLQLKLSDVLILVAQSRRRSFYLESSDYKDLVIWCRMVHQLFLQVEFSCVQDAPFCYETQGALSLGKLHCCFNT